MKWMFYFAILLALLMFVRGVLRALLAPMRAPSNFENPGPSRTRGSTVKQGTMEKDPVCGTYVDIGSALRGPSAVRPNTSVLPIVSKSLSKAIRFWSRPVLGWECG